MMELILDPPKISSIYRVTLSGGVKLGRKKKVYAHEPAIEARRSNREYRIYLCEMPVAKYAAKGSSV